MFEAKPPTLSLVDAEQIEVIARRLHRAFDLGNFPDPLDELIFIVLTTMTTDKFCRRVYDDFRLQIPRWEDVEAADLELVRLAIADAGPSYQKAPRIQAILRRLRRPGREHPGRALLSDQSQIRTRPRPNRSKGPSADPRPAAVP